MEKYLGFVVIIIASFLSSSCAVIENPSSQDQILESFAYDSAAQEYVFWLKVPYESTDLGMARVPKENVSVRLRDDKKNWSSLILIGCRDEVRCRYKSAIILVPGERELEVWQNFLTTGH